MEQPTLLVTTEAIGSRDLRMTVEIPEERVQQEMHRVAREISNRVTIPGFRKGKAPYAVILQRYGEDALREQVAEELTREVYQTAIRQEGITPYGPAHLDDVQLHPMRLTFTLPLPPVVRLGDYRSLRLPFPSVEVTEEEILSVLEDLRQEYAVLEPVEGRGAQPGDVLRIQVEGYTDQGALFLKDDDATTILDPEDPNPAPGFYRALEGMAPGEERAFRLNMPSGQPSPEVEFRVRLLSLARRILPELDDDLARTVGPYPTLDALKEHIRQELLQLKERETRADYAEQIIQALVDQSEVEYPSILLEEQLDAMMEDLDQKTRVERHMTLQDFLKLTGQSMESLREQLRPEADRRVRQMLVLAKVAGTEGLEVSEEEVDQRIRRLSEARGLQAEARYAQLDQPEHRERISARMLYEKVVDRLIAIARGEPVPEPPAGGVYATP